MIQSIENKIGLFVDEEDALSRLRGNRNAYRALLFHFLESHFERELQRALDAQDTAAAAAAAHALKGVAANLSLSVLHRAAHEMEKGLRDGHLPSHQERLRFDLVYEQTSNHIRTIL